MLARVRALSKVSGGVGLEGSIAVMNACILRRISEEELGGDPNADPSDSFVAELLFLGGGDRMGAGGKGFSENTVRTRARRAIDTYLHSIPRKHNSVL